MDEAIERIDALSKASLIGDKLQPGTTKTQVASIYAIRKRNKSRGQAGKIEAAVEAILMPGQTGA